MNGKIILIKSKRAGVEFVKKLGKSIHIFLIVCYIKNLKRLREKEGECYMIR